LLSNVHDHSVAFISVDVLVDFVKYKGPSSTQPFPASYCVFDKCYFWMVIMFNLEKPHIFAEFYLLEISKRTDKHTAQECLLWGFVLIIITTTITIIIAVIIIIGFIFWRCIGYNDGCFFVTSYVLHDEVFHHFIHLLQNRF
ncbi:hypothetical protein ACJX0J_020767, partial [Zea mays]